MIASLQSELEARKLRSLIFKETFDHAVIMLMKEKHWNKVIFTERTGLDENTYSKIITKKDCHFTMSKVISICFGLQLDILTTEHLLKLKGHCFSPLDPGHIAYAVMIERSSDLDIEKCNEWLAQLGFGKSKYLGSQERGFH